MHQQNWSWIKFCNEIPNLEFCVQCVNRKHIYKYSGALDFVHPRQQAVTPLSGNKMEGSDVYRTAKLDDITSTSQRPISPNSSITRESISPGNASEASFENLSFRSY